jgi:hypothetical protein
LPSLHVSHYIFVFPSVTLYPIDSSFFSIRIVTKPWT